MYEKENGTYLGVVALIQVSALLFLVYLYLHN
jgi:hypothetical protein